MAHEKEPFISASRSIALMSGRRSMMDNIRLANVGGCSFGTDALVYEDQIVEIVASPVNSELLITRKANDNAVVIIKPDGELLRYHGEIAHMYRHLAKVHKAAFLRRQGDLATFLGERRKSIKSLGLGFEEDGVPRPDQIKQDEVPEGVTERTLILAEFSYEEIAFRLGDDKKGEIRFKDEKVKYKLNSPRLICFKNSPVCVGCGREGVLFRLEWPPHHGSPHLNLYSEDGELMTHDHIIPQSKYKAIKGSLQGLHGQRNLQTMCYLCNTKKADTLPEGIEENKHA